MKEYRKHLDPQLLSKIAGLRLRVRHVVEGYLAGPHRSPLHGLNVEFAEHRPYSPGQELKHIDWKLWARSDRFYVKLFEEETNVRAYFLMDGSLSMGYCSGGISKYDYGATLAASLACLLLTAGDAVGLSILDNRLRERLPPSASMARLDSFCRLLEEHVPTRATQMGPPLRRMAAMVGRRGLIVLVSDMIAPLEELVAGLKRFRYEGHTVIFIHVIDPAEAEFPFEGRLRFEDVESGARVNADARQIRPAYLESLRLFRRRLEAACRDNGADYLEARTDQALDMTLVRLLAASAPILPPSRGAE